MKRTGFTLTELVMVMILVGILSVYLVPRMNVFSGWGAQTTADRIASVLSSARRVAISSRHTVYVQLSTTQIRACLNVGCTQIAADFTGVPIELNAPSGASFSSSVTSFAFDPAGRSSSSSAITVQMENTTVQIEPITGLVRVLP